MFIIYVEAPPLHIDWALYLKEMEINKSCPPSPQANWSNYSVWASSKMESDLGNFSNSCKL